MGFMSRVLSASGKGINEQQDIDGIFSSLVQGYNNEQYEPLTTFP